MVNVMHCVVFGGSLVRGKVTLDDAFGEVVVGGEEVDGCGHRWVVGCDGVGEGAEGSLDAVELFLYYGVHGVVGWSLCSFVRSIGDFSVFV